MADAPPQASQIALVPAAAVAGVVDRILTRRPRVHAIVAPVAQPLVANVAAALGVDVSMTFDADEVAAMAERSDALLLNLGMMDRARREGVVAAVRTGVPFVLDPVKVDRSPIRLGLAHQLLACVPTVVKGNTAEMAALAPMPRDVVSVTTGAADVVALGGRSLAVLNGAPLLARVVATGCAAGLVVAAAVAVEADAFVAAAAGLALFGVAGETAALVARGPGSLAVELLDALAGATGADVGARMRLE